MFIASRTLGALIVMLALVSCSSNMPPRSKSSNQVVVVFGDSTTAPRANVRVFAAIVQARLPDTKVINAGIPGNTTRDALGRLDHDVIAHHPDFVTIFFGINDSAVDVWRGATAPRVPLGEYEANLTEILRRIRGSGAEPILLTPNPVCWTPDLVRLYGKPPYEPKNPDGWNVLLKHYAQTVREIAAKENVRLADVDGLFRNYAGQPGHRLNDLLLDGMHPNDQGHELIAPAILGALQAH
jgi:lysophospholipase L1-like esterase